jgi:hypothetical protein
MISSTTVEVPAILVAQDSPSTIHTSALNTVAIDIMSWWSGGGGDKSSQSVSKSAKDFTSDDATSAGYGAAENILNSGATAASDGMLELQQAGLVLQQQLLVQQVISDLTDRSYEKCITAKPNDTLSGSQVACIKATVNKWLDTNEFLTGRLAKKQQMAQQHQAQF